MLIKIPVCVVLSINNWEMEGRSGQTVVIHEAGGAQYQFSANPNDPQHPVDADARLRPYLDTMTTCEIEAEVSGRVTTYDGTKKQALALRKLTVRPVQMKVPEPAK